MQFVEVAPLLLRLVLLLFLVDVAIRLWKNVQAIFSFFRRERGC